MVIIETWVFTRLIQELPESVKEMDKIAKGKKKVSPQFTFKEPEVNNIREKTGLSQMHFARSTDVSKRTLENREQDHRYITGPARALLKLVESYPKRAVQALQS